MNASDGGDAGQWDAYNPWGKATDPVKDPKAPWDYYRWNGGWGYLYFSSLGMYYVHGRWYHPDLGLFLSPDAKGEYLYGSGQDAVNQAWALLQDLSNQSGEIEEDISDLADEARDYSLGARLTDVLGKRVTTFDNDLQGRVVSPRKGTAITSMKMGPIGYHVRRGTRSTDRKSAWQKRGVKWVVIARAA